MFTNFFKNLKRKRFSKLNYGVHEGLTTAFFLSMVGGILDSHTFLFRNKIFANTQTGNIVFLALSLASQNYSKTLNYFFSLAAFVLGIFLTEILKHVYKHKILVFVNIILITEMIFLILLTAIPKDKLSSVVISTISFVCSLQTNSFKSLRGSPYASTMCTGNLRSASANFLNFILLKNKKQGLICLQFVIILFAFFTGVILGYFFTKFFLQFTFLVCAFILTMVIILINYKHLSCS